MVRPALPPGIALTFTERMAGTCTPSEGSSAPFEFRLTITFDDLDEMLESRDHMGRIEGKVLAPGLSTSPLVVSEGSFQVLVDDRDGVKTREMRYAFPMRAADGHVVYFDGVKTVRDDPGPDVWADTTTLAMTLRDGSEPGARIIGRGVLRLSPEDLAHQLTTFRVAGTADPVIRLQAIACFGGFFARRLWETYGGVFAGGGVFDRSAPPRERRRLEVPAPEVHSVVTEDGLTLRLTRYRAGRKGPVLLVHGLGVSSLIFAIDTIRPNLLEYLVEHQYDVWLFDYRSSVALPYAANRYTADDVAAKDFPTAVAKVLGVTGTQSLQAVVHCFGANTFVMAMLAGLWGVRSAVVSQIAAHLCVPALSMAKAVFRTPDVLERLGITEMTTDVTSNPSLLERMTDLLLTLYPVHDGPRDTDAVSRRISFIYGQLYELDNLNQATYDNLHEMFGVAGMASLKHLATMIRARKIVTADGSDNYLREADGYPTLERLAIPMTIIHGERNKCWDPKSTAITYELLRQYNDPSLYKRIVIPGYGHIDCIFGKDAARDVFPHVLSHLDETAMA